MPKKTFTREQIVPKLRQIEVLIGQGKGVPLACKVGPLKRAVAPSNVDQTMKLEVRAEDRGGGIVLQQR